MKLPSYFFRPESVDPLELRKQAEDLFNSSHFYCSEVVVKIIRDTFCPTVSDEIIAMASGFPIGIGGGGCMCGSVAGGVMALGLVFGRTQPDEKVKSAEVMKYARELHDKFRKDNKVLCCRILTRHMLDDSEEHMKQCAELTGDVVQKVAEIILRETQ